MIQHLHAFWDDLWPNVVAPSAWTLAAITLSHLKRTAQAERHHQEMKDIHADIAGLSARLPAPRAEKRRAAEASGPEGSSTKLGGA